MLWCCVFIFLLFLLRRGRNKRDELEGLERLSDRARDDGVGVLSDFQERIIHGLALRHGDGVVDG